MSKNAEELYYVAVETHSEITCINCRKTETAHQTEGVEAAEKFDEMGWRITRNQNVYCPTCAKKKLKS